MKTRELIAVRHGLEVHAGRLAARTPAPEAAAAIGEQLAAMESSVGDYAAFVAADLGFHQAVAAPADSALLGEIIQTVRSLTRVWVERALAGPGEARLAVGEHRDVFEAIRDGDPDRAAAAMNTHMDSAARRLSATLDETEQE